MDNKVKLITPFLMLLAGALASVIMYIRKFDLFTMLWVLLVVLVIFYIIGDVVRYIYASIRPRIIPNISMNEYTMEEPIENVVAKDDTENTQDQEFVSEGEDKAAMSWSSGEEETDDTPRMADASDEEGYTDENLD